RGPFGYHSSTRGTHPYRPRDGGVEGRLAEIPTTLPTLDELLGLGLSERELADRYLDALGSRPLDVLTVHAEVEGGAYLGIFAELLDRVRDCARLRRLRDVAEELDRGALPVCRIVQQTRPGRAGTVSCQGDPMHSGC
ncbi:MAG: 4-deoxy-4-formamido-L-arabinose-phosphoundecaprenol deformylase, partial [Candidatus Binatia bacterium]